jgi:replicative superfamily II helicase
VAEYKNMAGRAGRLGFNEEGKAIILAGTEHEREVLFSRYVMGELEEMRSSFDPKHLETWVLRLLVQIDRVPRRHAVRLLANTYGGYLATRRRPEWCSDMEARLEALMDRMLDLELIEKEGDDVRLTLLGRAFGESALSFESNMRLVELLRRVRPEELTAERLMAFVQALPESDGGYTPMMRRGQKEAVRPREASLRYGTEPIRLLQQHARDAFDYYARCKRAAILWDWVSGVPTETIEQRYTTTPYQGRIGYGDVRKFADATRFHLRSAHQIASVMLVGQGPDEEAIERLLKRLELGIPADALGLLDIPASLSRGEYLALYGVGVKSADDLWGLASDTLRQALGPTRASELEALRPEGVSNRN